MSLKQNLDSYSALELKEFIKEHNKRVRGMIKEEVKEFRKEKLSELIIKAVGKKPDLIEKMDKIAKKKDVSSFKLIKTKGKTSDEQKETLDKIHKKEVKKLYKDFAEGKIDKKKLNKELLEIKKERVRADMPKLKIVKGEEPQAKPKVAKPKEKAKPKKEPKSEPDSDEPKSEFKLPKFYDTASPEIKKNLIKGVNNNILSSNPALLKAQYKGAKLIKKGLNEKKSDEERIEGLSRAMDALEDDKDKEIYKAIYNAKLNKKKINDLFLKIGTELMVGDSADKKSFRPYLSKQKLEVQKKFLRKNKEAYLSTVVGLNDKTGESKKVNDAVDRKIKEDKLKRQADFQAAKKAKGE